MNKISANNINKIKVVYLIDSLGSGGAQRQFVELIKGLDRDIIDPVVVIYHDIQYFRYELDESLVPVYLIPKKDKIGITFIYKFHSLLNRIKPHLVHSFLNTPNFYARMAKLLGDVKCVVTSERNMTLTMFHMILEKITWKISDHIIVNAERTASILNQHIGISHDKITYIPNGIDFCSFVNKDENKIKEINLMRTDAQDFLIGVIGRVCEQKGQTYLVDAAHMISIQYPQLKYKICFWGREDGVAYCETLRSKIKLYNLEDHFAFCEVEKDISSVLSACDLIVLPSLWEGFPNALVEAMAAGRPVVTTRIADNEKIVNDNEFGFLVSPGNAHELANKIIDVIQMTPEKRIKVGCRAQQHIVDNFGIDKLVKRTINVYRAIGIT